MFKHVWLRKTFSLMQYKRYIGKRFSGLKEEGEKDVKRKRPEA